MTAGEMTADDSKRAEPTRAEPKSEPSNGSLPVAASRSGPASDPGGGQPAAEDEALASMGLLEHLEELRRRLVRSLIALLVTFVASWPFHERIYEFLARPIHHALPDGTRLAFLGITDPMIIYIKVTALFAVFIASPVVLWQVWAFIAPGLYKRERRLAAPFILCGSLLFLAGGAFAYYIAFPFAVAFLLEMGAAFEPTITVDRYLGFLMTVILGMGVMFELPTVIFFLSRLGIVTPAFLMRHFRWAVLGIFLLAAIITPTPDVLNLCIFALPALALYLVGVGVAALFGPGGRGEKLAADEPADSSAASR